MVVTMEVDGSKSSRQGEVIWGRGMLWGTEGRGGGTVRGFGGRCEDFFVEVSSGLTFPTKASYCLAMLLLNSNRSTGVLVCEGMGR